MKRIFWTILIVALATVSYGETWHRVAYDNGGVPGEQPHLWEGADYTYPVGQVPVTEAIPADSPARTVAFGMAVMFGYQGLIPDASYRIRATFLSEHHTRSVRAQVGTVVVDARVTLPNGEIVIREWDVPPAETVNSTLTFALENVTGPNAVVSCVEVLSSDPTLLQARPVPGFEPPRLSPRPVALPGVKALQLSLNGQWRFHTAPPEGFFEHAAEQTQGWVAIEVPGEWAMQGFTVRANTAAGYRREFEIPEAWHGHRIKLRCDAVYSDCTVWVNGKEVGGHLGGFTPFELDITDAVTPALNTIALAVQNESVADTIASGTLYAVHPLGGIMRKIGLFAVPDVNAASLHVSTDLDDEYINAILNVELVIANESDQAAEHLTAELELRDPDGKSVAVGDASIALPAVPAGQTRKHIAKVPVRAPRKWDAEHPNLYLLQVALKRGGRTIETVQRRVGFREIEVQGSQLLVNGRSVKLRGVCRHEVHPLRGRSLAAGQWREDALIFRAGNVNFIRTSHYPPAEEFLAACDELGLYVEDEAPFCWAPGHGGAQRRATVPQTLDMVQRDRSHPSVIMWSLANESKWGANFEASSMAVRRLDPSRPQIFSYGWSVPAGSTWYPDFQASSNAVDRLDPSSPESVNSSWIDIHSWHYPGPDAPARADEAVAPVLYDEYCHLNSYNRSEWPTDPGVRDAWGEAVAAMWDKMYASRGTLGGSLWAAIDDTFFLPDGRTVGYGTWGPIDGWRRSKPEYWHMKKIYSPVHVTTRRLSVPLEDHPLRVPVENRFDFSNLNELKIEWRLGDDSSVALTTCSAPDIPPRSSGVLEIPVNAEELAGKRLYLRFTSPLGYVVDEVLLQIGDERTTPTAPDAPGKTTANPTVRVEQDAITVSGKDFAWQIDKQTGLIVEGRIGKDAPVIGGPHLMLLPLKGGSGQMKWKDMTYPPHTDSCSNWKADSVEAHESGGVVTITVKGSYSEAEGSYTLSFRGDGALELSYDFTSRIKVNPRQAGMVFELPKRCDTLSWQRKAQWTVYPADHIGRPVGSTKAFAGGPICGSAGPRTKPDGPWAHDASDLGCNDFRSTKMNVMEAALATEGGSGMRLDSDGSQHVRAWVADDGIRMLVADHANGGGEMFFHKHVRDTYRPLEKGSKVAGTIRLRMTHPADRLEHGK